MPKRKPCQVITHRIELQETERAALEAALAGRFVTNAVGAVGSVFTGVGAALAPFAGAFSALTALWIADRTLPEIIENVKEKSGIIKGAGEDLFTWVNPSKQAHAYQYIVAYLKACSGWANGEHSVMNRLGHLVKDLQGMGANPILLNKLFAWSKVVKAHFNSNKAWPNQSPPASWVKFYPPRDYMADLPGGGLMEAMGVL